MSSFQEAFPELKARAPQLPGAQPQGPSVLYQLRRQQLEDLGRAFGIRVSGTKDQMLPLLLDAEARGVFKGPPRDPYYLRKAARSPDDRGTVLYGEPAPEEYVGNIEDLKTDYELATIDRQHIGVLRRRSKDLGMVLTPNTTKDEMLAYIKGKNAASEPQT